MLGNFALLAQAADAVADNSLDLMALTNLGLAIAIIAVAIAGGLLLSKSLRMPDYGWKIGLILFTIVAGLVVTWRGWPPKLGIDLSGGVILVYEVDQDKKEDRSKKVDMDKLIAAVSRRVNPSGTKEITIRPYGVEQIEIIIPEVDEAEVRRIEKIITNIGSLEFRIVATRQDDADLIAKAESLPPATKEVKGTDGRVLARWVPVVNKLKTIDRFRGDPSFAVRDLGKDSKGNERVEVLMVMDRYNVTGGYLSQAMPSERNGQPCVEFAFNSRGSVLFGGLTGANLPDQATGRERQLGIILDDYLQSAPNIKSTITERGDITGDFSPEEVADLVGVLNAGALPSALRKEPSTRLLTGPTLGEDTIKQAKVATAASMFVVVTFMIVYYRLAGVIASFALVLNLLLTVAMMILIKAAFTLTGVAGLALTLGMAVDANVLIYERMREEFAKGATLRMAIRNGFARANVTIIDSNLTTLITAVVLYVLGTDQIKGFAVTLIIGLIMSLFTAIFVSRVLLDILEKKRWITQLKMMQFVGFTNIDFIGAWRVCAAVSTGLMVLSLLAVGVRGKGLFDIDFTGGTQVQLKFDEAQNIGEIRKALSDLPESVRLAAAEQIQANQSVEIRQDIEKELGASADQELVKQRVQQRIDELATLNDITVNAVKLPGEAPDKRFNINTSNPSIAAVETIVKELFKGKLAHNSVQFEPLAMVTGEPASKPAMSAPANGTPAEGAKPDTNQGSKILAPNFDPLAAVDVAQTPDQEPQEKPAATKPADEKKPADDEKKPVDDKKPAAEATRPVTEEKKPAAEEKPAVEEKKPLVDDSQPVATPKPVAAKQPEPGTPAVATPSATTPPGTTPPATALSSGDAFAGGSQTTLTFKEPIRHDTLEAEIRDAMDRVKLTVAFRLSNPEFSEGSRTPYATWELKIAALPSQADEILNALQQQLVSKPEFPQSSNIGGKVAGSTRLQAIYALLASLVLIVAYIWIRFEKVVFGLAAVVALVHDVVISLGFVAFSLWLAPILGFLQVDAFKVDLNIVAALLTIVGYSLNDTIVVFDRIREVRGKSPNFTKEMLNLSVNQTLSRTLLTGLTTIFVLIILYFWGGQGIHGFAYCLLVGMFVGTYSSVYVAAPILLWLMRPAAPAAAASKGTTTARVA